ncbi:unnamed protein product [Effrenium voratum]|uniref:MORN repeat-containing protein n=1 Tax=Effrenium voratum TaxID=2562239 RepID=A0AA36IHP9_9DINO|nr:unnamed protein product [Effrenium voratum]CAJ1439023.1 unnamed protein product [Effrenium voratum]
MARVFWLCLAYLTPVQAQQPVIYGESILLVVVGVILFGLCTGLCAFAIRNRKDLAELLPAVFSSTRTVVEQPTEEDRIAFERAERRKRRKEELREAAEALEDEETRLEMGLPSTLEEGVQGRGVAPSSEGGESTNSLSLARGRKVGGPRRGSRTSDPGLRRERPSIALDPGEEGPVAPLVESAKHSRTKGRRHSIHGGGIGELEKLAQPKERDGTGSAPLKGGTHRAAPTSGPWRGTLSERGVARSSGYHLKFLADGRVLGTAADGQAQISGHFDPDNHRVVWSESHAWGTVKVTGHIFYKAHTPQITGAFKASDGGKGKLELSPE